jgi:hypothetical protein
LPAIIEKWLAADSRNMEWRWGRTILAVLQKLWRVAKLISQNFSDDPPFCAIH